MRKEKCFALSFAIVFAIIGLTVSCSSSGGNGGNGGGELDISVCNPANGPFSLNIDNEWFPLPVGQELVLEGEADGVNLRIEITVLNETEEVAGVTTRVVEESDYENDELVEGTRDFFVQAPDGTVCYYGEDSDIYENGEVVSHEGSWRAGEGENLPGIMMPVEPKKGMVFQQEYAPGIAEDMCKIMAFGETVTTPIGEFNDTMRTQDWNKLDNPIVKDTKYYARGVGVIVDEDAKLVSY